MAKKVVEEDDIDDFDEEEEDEEPDEDEEEEKPKKIETRGRPPKREIEEDEPVSIKHKVSSARNDDKVETTYSAYHLPERTGIKNDSNNTPVGEDIYSVLAVILTKIERIEQSVC